MCCRRPGDCSNAKMNERLLLTCRDRPGIVAAVTGLLADCGANLLDLGQHSEPDADLFAMRAAYSISDTRRVREGMRELGERFEMSVRFSTAEPKRVAILCSAEDHCVTDLMWRFESGNLTGDVIALASNRYSPRVAVHHSMFQHIPDDNMPQHESALLRAVEGAEVVILARYMRILSEAFLDAVGCPVINIHHSFLPAFIGIDPYEQARERGVKLIGATAHYVVPELDAGPIIEQDVVRVTHEHTVEDMRRAGQDVERTVLARAVRWHLEDRVAVFNNRTIVL